RSDDALSVEEGAVRGTQVAQDVVVPLAVDLAVLAGDLAIGEPHRCRGAPSEHAAVAQRVFGDPGALPFEDQPGCGRDVRRGRPRWDDPSLSEDARTRGALQDGQRPATGSLSWKHTGQTDTSSPGSRRYHRGRALRDFDLLVTAPCEDQAAPRRLRRARGLPLRGGTGRSGVGLPDGQAEGFHAPGAGADRKS